MGKALRLDVPLKGERIALREVRPSDADGPWASWMRNAEILRYTEARFTEHTPQSLRDFARAMLDAPHSLFLAIEDEGGRHIGNIKLGPVDRGHARASVGIIIGDVESWGKGYGTEAVVLLRDHAFGVLGLHKLTAGAVAANAGSVRVFEKAGFSRDGLLLGHCRYDGRWHDVIALGCVNPVWRGEGR